MGVALEEGGIRAWEVMIDHIDPTTGPDLLFARPLCSHAVGSANGVRVDSKSMPPLL